MKKEVTETREIRNTKYFCDVCGNEIVRSLKQCDKCSKHLCKKCIGHSEYEFGGDYETVHCSQCWDLGEVHRKEIERLEDEINTEHGLWVSKCKNLTKL